MKLRHSLVNWAADQLTLHETFRRVALFGMHVSSGSPQLSKLRSYQSARELVADYVGVKRGHDHGPGLNHNHNRDLAASVPPLDPPPRESTQTTGCRPPTDRPPRTADVTARTRATAPLGGAAVLRAGRLATSGGGFRAAADR